MFQPAPPHRSSPAEPALERYLRMKARIEEQRRLKEENRGLLAPDRIMRQRMETLDFPRKVLSEALGIEGRRAKGRKRPTTRMKTRARDEGRSYWDPSAGEARRRRYFPKRSREEFYRDKNAIDTSDLIMELEKKGLSDEDSGKLYEQLRRLLQDNSLKSRLSD